MEAGVVVKLYHVHKVRVTVINSLYVSALLYKQLITACFIRNPTTVVHY